MASIHEENAALIREFLTTVVAGGDTEGLGIFLSGDSAIRHPVVDDRKDNYSIKGTFWSTLTAANLNITVDDIVASGEKVAVRGTLTGIQRESLLGEVSTEGSFDIAIVWFCRVDNGQILDTWSLPSEPWLVRQLNSPLGGN